MSVRVSVAVMAHPDRAAHVAGLLNRLDRAASVAWDTDGPATSNPQRRWSNGMRAWDLHDRRADWHLVIQDDAVVADHMVAGVERALTYVPDRSVVSLYLGGGMLRAELVDQAVEAADRAGAAWVSLAKLLWGVAVAVPVDLIDGMLDWCDRQYMRRYDARVGRYFQLMGFRAAHTWPSLVDHRDDQSLCGHDVAPRKARRFHTGSALDVDWARPAVAA